MPNNPIGPGPKAGRNYRVEVVVYDVYTTEAVVGFSATANASTIRPLINSLDPPETALGPVDMVMVADFIKGKVGGQ